MNFTEIANARQSCRKYDAARAVEQEKLDAILEAARLSPSACNGQPYHLTVCTGESARAVASSVTGMGMNKFAADAPVMIVISEGSYVASAALGAKVKKNDYRSIDIGILSAYVSAGATAQGLDTCILGWFDDQKIRNICHLDKPVRLVITLGYAAQDYPLRPKKKKAPFGAGFLYAIRKADRLCGRLSFYNTIHPLYHTLPPLVNPFFAPKNKVLSIAQKEGFSFLQIVNCIRPFFMI